MLLLREKNGCALRTNCPFEVMLALAGNTRQYVGMHFTYFIDVRLCV